MSNLISLNNVSLAFGLHSLLDKVKLHISSGERVCLIGRNGAGKSSLLKIIEGAQVADEGEVWRKPKLKLARLEQELPQQTNLTVYEFVATGLAQTGKLLAAYHSLTLRLATNHTNADLLELERLQQAIDANDGWQLEQTIKTTLDRLELAPEKYLTELSGGWQRRAALAKALVVAPELLLLDEPTNHLDIEAIQWLEDQLIVSNLGLLFITHDRSLLQRLATRIIELDRGNLTSWPGDYANFLHHKAELLHAETKQAELFDKKLAQEEQWIRQGIKARRTRNEGRVRALESLRKQRGQRRELQGKATFQTNNAEKSGQLVIEAQHVTHGYGQPLIENFSLRIMRGDRIGLIGSNGVGKSTLLNILLGNLTAQHGSITHGTKLKIAYFDQLRQTLALEKTVVDNVAQGHEFVEINGQKKHIMSYLTDFLFTPQRALTPVKALSGGECNRLLLARLFSQPANLLVMDEPTNDLDIETLELLEELLSEYTGSLLLVSHDRAFLDNVVTSTLVFSGQGKIQEYIGGYQDWLQQAKISKDIKIINAKPISTKSSDAKLVNPVKKLNYKEQLELNNLPKRIEQLEAEQLELQQLIADPKFYQQNASIITDSLTKLDEIEKNLSLCYQRWQILENNK